MLAAAVRHIHLHAEAWVAIATWLTLFVLLASAVIALRQLRQARQLQEEEAQPVVVVDVYVDTPPRYIHIYLENLGKTIARDVRVHFTPPLKSMLGESQSLTYFDHPFAI